MNNLISRVIHKAILPTLALSCTFFSLKSETISVNLDFDPSEFQIDSIRGTNGKLYTCAKWNKLTNISEPGEASLPVKIFRLIVPTLSTNFSARITSVSKPDLIKITEPIYPAQKATVVGSITNEIFEECKGMEYLLDKNPAPKIEILDDTFIDGDKHIVSLKVTPVTYAGKTSMLNVYSRISVDLNYDLCDYGDLKETVLHPPVSSSFMDLSSLVENPDMIRKVTKSNVQSSSPDYYCIVTSDVFVNDFEDLKIWKSQKGYKVDVVSIESIISEFKSKNPNTVIDPQYILREYLKEKFNIHGAFFCLLAGDYFTNFPIFKLRNDYVRVEYSDPGLVYNSNKFVPSDCYFSDLTHDYLLTEWHGSNDNYGLLSDFSYAPEIYCGRLLCHSSDDIKNYIEKLIIYESFPGRGEDDYLDSLVVFNQYDMASDKHGEAVCQRWGNTFSKKNLMIDTYYPNSSNAMEPSPKGKDVILAISQAGFSSWGGHGNPGSVITSAYKGNQEAIYPAEAIVALNEYTRQDVYVYGQKDNGLDRMSNINKPAVGYSISCNLVPFDNMARNESSYYNIPYNMGSSFTCGGSYGGIALIANTRYTYSSIGFNNEQLFAAEQELLFIDFIKNNFKIGISHALSLYNCFNASLKSNTDKIVSAGCSLIGDPEFDVWLGKPKSNNFSVVWNNNKVRLTVKDKSIGKNAFLSLYDGQDCKNRFEIEPQSYQTIYTNNATDIYGSLVSVWLPGCIPYVNYIGRNCYLTDCNRSFIVKDAELGNTQADASFTIGENAVFNLRALNNIKIHPNFHVLNGGKSTLKCDETVTIDVPVESEKGSYLNIIAPKVVLEGGCKLSAGVVLTNK